MRPVSTAVDETPTQTTTETTADTSLSPPVSETTVTSSSSTTAATTEERTETGVAAVATETPPPVTERKTSRLAVLGRIFRPWKWKRRKKTSDRIQKRAIGERTAGHVRVCVMGGVLPGPRYQRGRNDVEEDLCRNTRAPYLITSSVRRRFLRRTVLPLVARPPWYVAGSLPARRWPVACVSLACRWHVVGTSLARRWHVALSQDCGKKLLFFTKSS